jgi:hypothetical protein
VLPARLLVAFFPFRPFGRAERAQGLHEPGLSGFDGCVGHDLIPYARRRASAPVDNGAVVIASEPRVMARGEAMQIFRRSVEGKLPANAEWERCR